MKKSKSAPPKKVFSKKIINYTMPPDVVEALEKIMKEEGFNTMTKAINACILQRKMMRESIREEEESAMNFYRDNMLMKEMISVFVGIVEQMKEHTKTS